MNSGGIKSVIKKLIFFILPTQPMRTHFIEKHKKEFKHIGYNIFWQSRLYPADPELISIGNNVFITSNVSFVNHDTVRNMLNHKYGSNDFSKVLGCIEIGNNVMVGSNTLILMNVRIGSNVIIGAGSIVTKDIPSNCVAAGIPCRVIGRFDDFVKKRKTVVAYATSDEYWEDFYNQRIVKENK